MISRLELTGWRAYDHVALTFEPGTTFVVARNGIGKTALLQGAAYALYGDRSGFGTPASIRAGHSQAVVAASVILDTGEMLRISRTLGQKKTSLVADVDGTPLSSDDVDGLLSTRFGADIGTLARLTFLPAGSLTDYADEKFHLHQHLCRLFGVDQLEAVQDDLKQLGTQARSELRKVKEIKKASDAEVASWRAELEQVEAEQKAVASTLAAVKAELARAEAVTRAAAQQGRYEARRAENEAAIDLIREKLRTLASTAADTDADLATVLADLDQRAGTRLGELERERGRLEGRVDMLDSSRHQLDDADADCPVCLRPLDAETRRRAEEAHVESLTRSRAEIAAVTEHIEKLEQHRLRLKDLRHEFASIPALPERPHPVRAEEVAAALDSSQAANEKITELEEAAGTFRARTFQLRAQLDDDRQKRDQHRRAVQAYRREALVEAASTAVKQMVERLVTEQINPLAAQVEARWKVVFKGSRPALTLDPSGELKLTSGDVSISFPDMSAGERAVALLVTRLLVLGATSASAFMWLDEPLEQLDPLNRRLVAQLLTASSRGAVRQLVLTTFEEEIARRLEQKIPGVHLEYVTAGD